MSQRPRAHLVTYAVIPFLLLSSAQSTVVRTKVYLDGSLKREVTAEFLEQRRENVLPQLKFALPEADEEKITPVAEGLRAVRSVILASADDIEGAKLQYEDVIPQPLSFFTYYTWSETVQVPSETATSVEKALPEKATFRYVVVMPGTVTEATARPAKLEKAAPKDTGAAAATVRPGAPPVPPGAASPAPFAVAPPPAAPAASRRAVPSATPTPSPSLGAPAVSAPAVAPPAAAAAPAGAASPAGPAPEKKPSAPSLTADKQDSTATFTLSAASEAYDISVTSRRVRWGYLAVFLYILAFVAYRIAAFLVHRARVRPRRI